MAASKRPVKAPPKPRGSIKPEGSVALNMNVPAALVERLDAWTAALNGKDVGPRWTRTDLVKAVLARALEERGAKGEAP